MRFLNPPLLFLLLLLPVFAGWLFWRERLRQARLGKLGDSVLTSTLNTSSAQRIKSTLWLLTLGSLIAALARPAWGIDVDIVETEGISAIFLLDVSRSMNAEDILPSRLERAKLALRDMFEALAGNQIGLIVFAGSPFVQFPLTPDTASAQVFLDSVTTNLISRQGTDLAAALRLGIASFNKSYSGTRIIILMTDGENHEGDPLPIADEAAQEGIIIYTVGYGASEGSPIPLRDVKGAVTGYQTDQLGDMVLSVLDEPILREIAVRTSGAYERASPDGSETPRLLNFINQNQSTLLERSVQNTEIERFELFVALAFLLLTLEILLPLVGKRVSTRAVSLLLLIMLSACAVNPAERNNAGVAFSQQGQYIAAVSAYQLAQVASPDRAEPYFNMGIAYFQIGDTARAIAAFQQALKTSDADSTVRIYYNLGNVYFQIGHFDDAVWAYQQTLLLNPDDTDARHNLELALKRLNELPAGPSESPSSPENPTPTAAPSPEQSNPVSQNPTPAPPADALTVQDAERILDAIQHEQRSLEQHGQSSRSSPLEKDW